ncbi:MAG: AMP-binding protein [Bryobacteraceae bacterium]
MNLTHLFDLSLVGRRDAVALEFQAATYTFGDLDARSNRLAQLLRQRGVETGDRLCVYLVNCVEMIDIYLACVKLGVIFVPINILYRDREIAHILADSEPAAVVANGEVPTALPVWTAAELSAAAANLPNERPALALDGDTPAGIIYTSGTTGASKGAVLTHNNFAANAINLLASWQITGADRFLLALPLFHVHGLGNGLHCWLASGCRMRLLERFEHHKAASEFLDFRPTLFFGVPTIYVRLLEIPEAEAHQIGAAMRLFVSGSAPLSAQVFEEFRSRFGHAILERYGMSENMMNMSNPYLGERRPGSVGLPLPGVSVRVLDPEGRPVRTAGGRRRDRRSLPQGFERVRRVLEARRGHARSLRRWLFSNRRSGGPVPGRLLQPVRTQERSHHLRRFQYLSARDRGVPGRAGWRVGSGRHSPPRSRSRRGSGGLHRREQADRSG